jgi:hypothetical protein
MSESQYERYVVSDFVPDMIPTEQELYEILEEMSLCDVGYIPDDDKEHPYFHNYSRVCIYVLQQEQKSGNALGLTYDELNEEVTKLVIDHTLTQLANKGLVDVQVDDNGEMTYGLTPDGAKIGKMIVDGA